MAKGYRRFISGGLCLILLLALCPAVSASEPVPDDNAARLCAYLHGEIERAARDGGSTEFDIPESAIDYSLLSVPKQALGGAPVIENGAISAAAKDAVMETVWSLVRPVFSALTLECVFDLYWFDGIRACAPQLAATGERVYVVPGGLRIPMGVLPGYGADYVVSAAGTEKAKAAAANAAAIVAAYADRTDYEKLAGYADEICALVTYSNDPALTNAQANDPVRVFDGDSATNVVCGGYAKAFAYLCSLTEFSDPRIRCLHVSGDMEGGGHAWNIVTMEDGRNYLVDVTNSDAGDAAYADRRLFLRGYYTGDVRNGYVMNAAGRKYAYVYGQDASVYENAALELSAGDYGAFADVKNADWFKQAVDWAVARGVTTGKTETAFAPDEPCTTAQILTFLYRAKGAPEPGVPNPFADVSPADYYYRAALWAYENGLAGGTELHGAAACTRAAAVTYLWKLAGSPAVSGGGFRDVDPSAAYAAAVAWAVREGVTSGTSETEFSPDRVTTRAQIMTFLYRARDEQIRVTDATPGFSDEGAENLFDGDPGTKWCVRFEGRAFVEWQTPVPFPLQQIRLITANDNSAYPGRNPKTWTLYGRNGADEAWKPVYAQSYAPDDVNYTAYVFPLSEAAGAFRMFRFEVTETTGADVLQLSGIELVPAGA